MRGRSAVAAFGLLLLVAHAGFGAWRLSGAPQGEVPGVTLRIVQPAILQSEKWDPARRSATSTSFSR